MMSEAQRVQLLVEQCCGGSSITFAKSVGIDKFRLSRIMHGEAHCRITKLIPAILKVYPDVNPDWLRTGEGYPGDLTKEQIKAKYERIVAEKDREIEELKKRLEKMENHE